MGFELDPDLCAFRLELLLSAGFSGSAVSITDLIQRPLLLGLALFPEPIGCVGLALPAQGHDQACEVHIPKVQQYDSIRLRGVAKDRVGASAITQLGATTLAADTISPFQSRIGFVDAGEQGAVYGGCAAASLLGEESAHIRKACSSFQAGDAAGLSVLLQLHFAAPG